MADTRATRAWTRGRRFPLLVAVAGILAAAVLVMQPAPVALATTFTVNSTLDDPDASVDGVCETAVGNGVCTLRAAIEEIQVLTGTNEITFAITSGVGTVRTITIAGSDLPPLNSTGTLTVDGWSQGVFDGTANYSGPPLIRIDSTAGGANGLEIADGSVTIKGVAITGFTATAGIGLTAAGGTHVIVGCYLGVAPNLAVTNATIVAGNSAGISVQGTPNVTIGGTGPGEGNVIAGNVDFGVTVLGADDTKLLGNYIGTDRLGTTGRGNGQYGAILGGTNRGIVGDGTAAGRNIFSGNALGPGLAAVLAVDTTIRGNYFGVSPDGATPLPNLYGIYVASADNTDVGGSTAADRNIISGNSTDQILLTGICGCAAQTRVRGNYIGTNLTGTAAVTSVGSGVHIVDGVGIIVGGITPGEGNLISGNSLDGVTIEGDLSEEISVGGNKIGTNAAGTAAIPNGRDGVGMIPANGTDPGPHKSIIGSETAGSGNLISGNIRHGVYALKTRQNTTVFHNLIGVDVSGIGALPNGRDGVLIENASNLTVRENVIANNGQAGIVSRARPNTTTGNVLTANSIFNNQGLGIDVTNTVDGNGVGNGQSPPNSPNALNYPVIASASTSAVGTVVTGTLASTASTSFRIELFASPSCDGSGYGEGRAYVGGFDVGTDGSGNATFSNTLATVPNGQVVTATATSAGERTSEFSLCKLVTTADIVVTPTSGLTTSEAGGFATFTVALSTLPTADVTIGLTSSRPAEGTVSPASLTFTAANGTTPQTVRVTGVADSVADGNQQFSIVTAAAVSADPVYSGMNASDVAVTNQDALALPTVSIGNASASEGNGVATPMTFTVTLSPASTQAVTVPWTIIDGTAKVPSDVEAASGTLTIAAGQTSGSIVVNVVGDALVEGTETFTVRLSNVSNAVIGKQDGVGTILDDDVQVSACAPQRPPITVTTQRTGTDRIVVTVKAGQGTLQKISFGSAGHPMQNAIIETIGPSGSIKGFGEITPAAGVTQQSFIIQRLQAGQAVMVDLEVQDGCGSWKTFVGSGVNGF